MVKPNEFASSKLNDRLIVEWLEKTVPGRCAPIEYLPAVNPDDDFKGIDFCAIDGWNLEKKLFYDSKYLQTPYVWFEKRKAHYVCTTHYFYVFKNAAFTFKRDGMLELCEKMQYAERPGNVDGTVLVTVPYLDMLTYRDMISYVDCSKFIEEYRDRIVGYDKLGALELA